MYFQFFCLGRVFDQLILLINRRSSNILVALGILCWILDAVWKNIEIPETDPSYFWVFATFGIMVIFNRMQIEGETVNRIITWVAKRSYSIYLLQFMTISKASGLIYRHSFFGNVAEMTDIARIAIWIFVTISSYFLALLIASICDPFLLEKTQRVLKRRAIAKK